MTTWLFSKIGFFRKWGLGAVSAAKESHQEFASRLAFRALALLDPAERVSFMEQEIRHEFGFRRVEILLRPEGPERFSSESVRIRDVLSRLSGVLEGTRLAFIGEAAAKELHLLPILETVNATYVFPLGQSQIRQGVLLLDSHPQRQLKPEIENWLQAVCDQVSIVLENSSLLQGKLALQNLLSRQAQMVQLGEMTARIAHEIKNPLSAIKTIVQVMQEDASLHPQYTRDLELIVNEMDRLNGGVMQLLSFARPGVQADEAVELHEVVESVFQFLERDIQKANLVIETEIPSDLPAVQGTQTLFREILLNLVLNAIQACGSGSRILLQAWEGMLEDVSERFVLLVVEDDGPGVPSEIQEKVFAPFFTTKQRGTGLGLAIVKRDVEQLGGRIILESPAREGHGTRILIHLPVRGPEGRGAGS